MRFRPRQGNRLCILALACGLLACGVQNGPAESRPEAPAPEEEADEQTPEAEEPAEEAPETAEDRAAQVLIVDLRDRLRAVPTSGAARVSTPEPLPVLAPVLGAARAFIEHYLGPGQRTQTTRPATADCPSAGNIYDFTYVPLGLRAGGLHLVVRYREDFVCDAHWLRTQ